MQVDPIKPTSNAPGTKRLRLKSDEPLLSFAFNSNLRRYTEELMKALDKIHEKFRNPCMYYADQEAGLHQGLKLVHFSAQLERSCN